MGFFIAYIVILHTTFCNGQFEKNSCVGDVEIAFSTVEKTFIDARRTCQDSSFGGDLVKIGSPAIQTAIDKNINSFQHEYLIGAYEKDKDREFEWLLDRTAVPKNPALTHPGPSGYENWNKNQPNNQDGKENCVAVGVHDSSKWTDVTCDEGRRYICQRDLISISSTGEVHTCQSTLSTVEVRWKKNSVIAESSNKTGIYQTIETNRATLYLENANITEGGPYTCVSTHEPCSASEIYEANVDGTPSIIKIENNKCNSSLSVTWKPSKSAVGFKHKITAANSTVFETPTTIDDHVTEITGLELSTNYTVEFEVCSTQESCNTANENGRTNGVTDPVTNPNLSSAGNGTCAAAWNESDETSTFTVNIQCVLTPTRSGKSVSMSSNQTVETNTLIFQPSPSRKCEVFIQAKGCGEIRKSVKANGVCTTLPREPDYVQPPTVFKTQNGNSHVIEMKKPDENNGLISCLFIVICYGKCSTDKFTFEKLMKANETYVSNSENEEYIIAAAISILNFMDDRYLLKLSEGNTTYCDALNDGLTNSSFFGTEIFCGQNTEISNTTDTSIFAVAVTPSDGEVLLKSSSVVSIQTVNETEETDLSTAMGPTMPNAAASVSELALGLIIGSIGIVIGIASIVASFIIAKKRKPGIQSNPERDIGHHADSGNTLAMTQMQKENTLSSNIENEPSAVVNKEIIPTEYRGNQYERQEMGNLSVRIPSEYPSPPDETEEESLYVNMTREATYEEFT